MNDKICFIGHRSLSTHKVKSKLYKTIEHEIKLGNHFFEVGVHGEYDKLVLEVCLELKKHYEFIKIDIVSTSLVYINRYLKCLPKGVGTIMYDIEEIHYKQRIIESNKKMVDNCNTLICYVDVTRNNSGAKLILDYAKTKQIKILNLYDKKDNSIHNLTRQEKEAFFENLKY